MPQKYKVILFDEICLIHKGFEKIFEKLPEFEFVAGFSDFDDMYEFLKKRTDIDILFSEIEYSEKDGIELIRYVHNNFPNLKIIALTSNKNEQSIFATLKAGAISYLYKKNANFTEIKNALVNVVENKEYFNEPVSNIIIQSYVKKIKRGEEISEKKPRNLTRREIQILKLVCEGLTNKQIADGLFISVRTVDAHKNHIMQKLGLKTTADLVKFAIKNGYVDLD